MRRQGAARAQQQRPRPLRPAELVAGEGEAVGAQPFQRDRHPPRRLHCVNVQQRVVAPAEGQRLGDGVDHAGLVVGQHQADQGRGAGRQAALQRREVQHPLPVHRQPFRLRRGGQYRRVLGGAGQEAAAPAQAANRQDVRLGPAGGEDHVPRPGAEAGRHLGARLFQQAPGGPALGMDGGRIAGQVQRLQHRKPGLGAQRLGGIGVKVEGGRGHASASPRPGPWPRAIPGTMPGRSGGRARPRTWPRTTSASDTPSRKSRICSPNSSQRS